MEVEGNRRFIIYIIKWTMGTKFRVKGKDFTISSASKRKDRRFKQELDAQIKFSTKKIISG